MPPGGNDAIQRPEEPQHAGELRENGKRPQPPDAFCDGENRIGASVPSAVREFHNHFVGHSRPGACKRREVEIPVGEQLRQAFSPAGAEPTRGIVVDGSANYDGFICHFSNHRNMSSKKGNTSHAPAPSSLRILSPAFMNRVSVGEDHWRNWPYQAAPASKKSASSRSLRSVYSSVSLSFAASAAQVLNKVIVGSISRFFLSSSTIPNL